MLQHIKFCKEGLLVRHGLSIKRANEPFSSPSHQLHWVMDQSWLLAPRSCPNQPEEESIFSLVKLLEYMSSFALKQQILSKFWHVCKQLFQNPKSISFDNFVFIYFFSVSQGPAGVWWKQRKALKIFLKIWIQEFIVGVNNESVEAQK